MNDNLFLLFIFLFILCMCVCKVVFSQRQRQRDAANNPTGSFVASALPADVCGHIYVT